MGCLYLVESPTSKQYIGITLRTLEARWAEHVKSSVRPRTAIHYAIRKYGADAFKIRTLVVADKWDYLCDLERKAVAAYGTKGPVGYNMTGGGDGVPDMCAESIATHKKNTSSGTLASWQREDCQKAHRASRADADYKRRQAEATRNSRLWDRADYRAATLAATSSVECRQKVSFSVQQLWKDPAYRARQAATRLARKKPRTEESKRLQGEHMRALIAERKKNGTYWL